MNQLGSITRLHPYKGIYAFISKRWTFSYAIDSLNRWLEQQASIMQPTSRRDESIRINYDNIDRSELPNSSSKVHHDVHLKESNYFWWKIWPATLSHIQIFIRYAMYAIYLNILINLIRFVIESISNKCLLVQSGDILNNQFKCSLEEPARR